MSTTNWKPRFPSLLSLGYKSFLVLRAIDALAFVIAPTTVFAKGSNELAPRSLGVALASIALFVYALKDHQDGYIRKTLVRIFTFLQVVNTTLAIYYISGFSDRNISFMAVGFNTFWSFCGLLNL